jgi:hypothetical protein
VADDSGEPVLVLRADRLRAARRVLVARQVEVSAEAGDVVAVEGANGSGKSTLLAAAAGVLPTGQAGRRPASVGYAPERADVLPRLTVWRWLTGLARTAGLSRAEAAGQAAELLARVGLAGAWHRPLRELARAFAAHVGGRGRAHLAASLATVPFAVAATAAAVGWSALSQPYPRGNYPGLLLDMITLHLAAAAFGVAVGALLVPPLVDRAGWRVCLATALLVALLLVPVSPMRPLLLLVTHPVGSVLAAAGLLAVVAAAVIGLTTATASRLP